MNILITGAGGFIGGHLCRTLEADHNVHGLIHDRGTCSQPVVGDVTDYARMLEIIVDHEIDQIYHLASKAVVRNCNADPLGCFRANALGTVTILEAARQSGRVKGIMCMESDKSYGTADLPYREDQALRPGGVYEASKSCVSQIIPAFRQTYGTPVFGIRSANVYGPNDRQLTRLIPGTICRLLNNEKPVLVEGAGAFTREFIYVDDLANYAMALMDAAPWGQSINVGSGEKQNIQVVLATICTLMNKADTFDILPRSSVFKEIPEQWLCLDRLHALVPDHEVTRLHDGLKKTIEWYECNH